MPQLTRVSGHRSELAHAKHDELHAAPYGVKDAPLIMKGAQEGTGLEDHRMLQHSGYGRTSAVEVVHLGSSTHSLLR